MKRFAFIMHYSNISEVLQGMGTYGLIFNVIGWGLQKLPRRLVKRLVLSIPPYRWFEISEVRSRTGARAEGVVIMCPFFPEQIATEGEEVIFRKILSAGRLAEELGADIVGLAGFTSIIGNEGERLAGELGIPVTSGNTYTAALAVEGIRRAAAQAHIGLNSAAVAVIGASGDIGSACCRVFAMESREIRLAARNEQRLDILAKSLGGRARVTISRYIGDAVRGSNIVLTATSSITTLIEPRDVKANAIICDVAIPHNVATDLVTKRSDVLIFEGGLAELPFSLSVKPPGWMRWVSPDGKTVYGCLAETILLALEGRMESFSLGRGNITPERVAEVLAIGHKHGFVLADFRYGGRLLQAASGDVKVDSNANSRAALRAFKSAAA